MSSTVNKVVLITGALTGIGRAAAFAFATGLSIEKRPFLKDFSGINLSSGV
jgi:hypothetical protein